MTIASPVDAESFGNGFGTAPRLGGGGTDGDGGGGGGGVGVSATTVIQRLDTTVTTSSSNVSSSELSDAPSTPATAQAV